MTRSETPRFTLGMCVHNDIDGVYFSCQGNRLLHPLIDAEGEILIIDNCPSSDHGKATKKFVETLPPHIRYVPYTEKRSTSIRNVVFDLAQSPIVICIDSHVLIQSGGVEAVVHYLENPDNQMRPLLVQGPLYYDDLKKLYSHWDDRWLRGLQGRWVEDPRAENLTGAPYEIPCQGLGCFSARKDHWLRFSEHFRGFGGEEGYIHRKYRRAGGACISIPAFRWVHRFIRLTTPKYIDSPRNRLFNYLIGSLEHDEEVGPMIEYFRRYENEKVIYATYQEALQIHRQSS